jgi:lipoyl(octanoyl) transferase
VTETADRCEATLSVADVPPSSGQPLTAFLLGEVPFDSLYALQRRLIYDVSGGRGEGAVIVCDHPSGISVGREGSRLHIRLSPEDRVAREWPVRWVARGGGVMLHVPGQVAVYPILPLSDLGLTPQGYIHELAAAVTEGLAGVGVHANVANNPPGVSVGRRRIAHVGVAVRNGVTSFGAVVNVAPDLEFFRGIDCDGCPHPMTSAYRESAVTVRVPAVRQLLTDAVARRFGFGRVSVLHTHPAVPAGRPTHAAIAAGR